MIETNNQIPRKPKHKRNNSLTTERTRNAEKTKSYFDSNLFTRYIIFATFLAMVCCGLIGYFRLMLFVRFENSNK